MSEPGSNPTDGSANDPERKPVSLGAGHRRTTAKADKAAAKAAKAQAKAAAKGAGARQGAGSRKQRPLPGGTLLRPVAGVAGKVAAFAKAGPRKVWAVWERAYDAVAARPVHAVRVLAAVVAAVAVLGGLFWLQTDRWVRTDVARAEATQAGEAATEQLLSYSFRSIDRQVEKAQDSLTGSFRDDYAKFVNETIAPAAKDKQAVVRTAVDRSAVIDATPGEVTLLVYFEQQAEARGSQEPVSGGISSVRVTLEKEDGRWKVSELTPV